jgi:hypothetical protein
MNEISAKNSFPSRPCQADIPINTGDRFSLKIGGTTYHVTTHFDTNGKQTVLRQFMELLKDLPTG